jgi:hypothetical protein
MIWLSDWDALAKRIDALTSNGEAMVSMLGLSKLDLAGVIGKCLLPELKLINDELSSLGSKHSSTLPQRAFQALQKYLGAWASKDHPPNADKHVELRLILPLAVFKAEFEFLIRDSEIEARSLVELAFQHLRQLIMVDKDVASKWSSAFKGDKSKKGHETKCEQLGSAHLLSHGIWAFKIHTTGAATDLVCCEPITEKLGTITRAARTLALTEWKRVRDETKLKEFASAAREQTKIYAAGALGALELKQTRYIVLITERDLLPPDDVQDGLVTYRHIVIPVAPSNPSRTA